VGIFNYFIYPLIDYYYTVSYKFDIGHHVYIKSIQSNVLNLSILPNANTMKNAKCPIQEIPHGVVKDAATKTPSPKTTQDRVAADQENGTETQSNVWAEAFWKTCGAMLHRLNRRSQVKTVYNMFVSSKHAPEGLESRGFSQVLYSLCHDGRVCTTHFGTITWTYDWRQCNWLDITPHPPCDGMESTPDIEDYAARFFKSLEHVLRKLSNVREISFVFELWFNYHTPSSEECGRSLVPFARILFALSRRPLELCRVSKKSGKTMVTWTHKRKATIKKSHRKRDLVSKKKVYDCRTPDQRDADSRDRRGFTDKDWQEGVNARTTSFMDSLKRSSTSGGDGPCFVINTSSDGIKHLVSHNHPLAEGLIEAVVQGQFAVCDISARTRYIDVWVGGPQRGEDPEVTEAAKIRFLKTRLDIDYGVVRDGEREGIRRLKINLAPLRLTIDELVEVSQLSWRMMNGC